MSLPVRAKAWRGASQVRPEGTEIWSGLNEQHKEM